MGYFKIDMETMQKVVLSQYKFTRVDRLCNQFNKMSRYLNHKTRGNRVSNGSDPYPWLDKEDPRRYMSDGEILDKTIDLSKSCLNQREKSRVMKLLKKYKAAFSLRDEIGECPNIRLNIDVIDESRFFVRPFRIAEKDKPLMDKQMNRLVALGTLTRNNTSHTSPVMLIARKITQDKRPVVDFRLLNTRIRQHNTATPLLRDIFDILGKAKCEVMSCVDIKDAFHSIRLNERSKEFCGILPYFGSHHYRYEVLPMGLAISPAAWSMYITTLLDTFGPRKRSFIAIMDDLLIHSTFHEHFELIEILLKGLISHGLKLSPKKSQLFRTKLVYMGNVFKISDQHMTVKPLRTRIEAIQNIPVPKTPRDCKSFCGVVNYLGLFCPDLQKLLQPIYHLTKKDVPFVWTNLQQKSFEEIKRRMCERPVLHLPTEDGRFILYSDTSRSHAGSALWQIQDGMPRLIGYGSKTLPSAAQNYSVTELEMFGLLINIQSWKNHLHEIEFDVAVDHKAVVQIMKGKNPPATNRIGALIGKLLDIPFNLYYVKGKDLILTDFLSRIRADRSKPHELIPISFMDITVCRFPSRYNHCCKTRPRINRHSNITTRSTTKKEGLVLPKVHGHDKPIDPHKKPEHQPVPVARAAPRTAPPTNKGPGASQANKSKFTSINKKPSQASIVSRKSKEKSIKWAQQKARQQHTPRLKQPQPPSVNPPSAVPNHVLPRMPSDTPSATPVPPQPNTVPMQSRPVDPPPEHFNIPEDDVRDADVTAPTTLPPPDFTVKDPLTVVNRPAYDRNVDLNTPSTNYGDLVEVAYRSPTKEDLVEPVLLADLVEHSRILHTEHPKQKDIDAIMKVINKKILRQVHLPKSFRDMHRAYLSSPHFQDIYLYLLQNKLPRNPRKRTQVASAAMEYMLLDFLLFKIVKDRLTQEYKPLLCIPTSKVDMLLHYFHSSLMGGHMGITKTYLTISQRFFYPNLAHHVRAYIIGCHVCQMVKAGKTPKRPFQPRININVPALTKVSMDVKYMPPSGGKKSYNFILVMLCEVSNFLVVCPLQTARTVEICKAINKSFIKYFSPPTHIMCDQDPAFMSTMAQVFFQHFGIRVIMVSTTNHKSLLAEHGKIAL